MVSSPAPTRSRRPRAARAGRRCTRTTRCFDERPARDRREPLLVLELDALPGADAGVRRDLHRLAVPGARHVAEPRVRGAAGDGHRLPRRQRLRLHLRQPGHRPGRRSPSAPGSSRSAPGYYYANWDELYAKWRTKMEALIAELDALEVPQPARVRARRGRLRRRPQHDASTRCSTPTAGRSGCRDLMWQHHFEFLLLGYGAYVTFAELCKAHLPDIPDQHIAQMVAGIDVLLFRPDAELRRLARLAIETGVDGGVRRGPHAARDRRRAGRERRRPRLARGARERQGPVVQHGDRRRPLPLLPQLARRPEHPVRVADRLRRRAQGGRGDRAPDGASSQRERDRLAERVRARCSTTTRGRRSSELLALSRTVFPYVEEHKFFCDYWFLTRWWNKIREFGALLADARLPRRRARTSSSCRATRCARRSTSSC